ncbi:hypothetical protein [Frankia sp. QA3]|uniref:hypothetical protein n=1 Tax=Frankia sp. QA3 TaxID=710111 RepID=UPI000269C7A3|nr:hypothetical protein [Frankia sp. QA3]EIV94540.1 hypothetical protein FraQA3DRAFT_4297 [Frankia sp. QA3]
MATTDALVAAAAGWKTEPDGTVYRLYDADGQDVTGEAEPAALYRRAVRVDLGTYCWGVARIDLAEFQGFVVHGDTSDPAEALRLVLAEPLSSAPTETLRRVRAVEDGGSVRWVHEDDGTPVTDGHVVG